jgi:lipid-A-disaccharide synthase
MLIKIKYANLINLVANKEIIPELLQYKCNSFIIYKEIIKLINDKKLVENQLIEVKNSLKIMSSNSINNPMKNATNEILKLCN